MSLCHLLLLSLFLGLSLNFHTINFDRHTYSGVSCSETKSALGSFDMKRVVHKTLKYATNENESINTRPIIGVLTQPSLRVEGKAYLVASYVKWIESAGARVIPFHFDDPKEKLQYLFERVNGIVFTGGGQDMKEGCTYYETAKFLFNLGLKANMEGEHFPMWGTCMGFQLFHVIVSGLNDESKVLDTFNSWGISYNLLFTPGARNSKLLSSIPPNLFESLSKENITMNYHHFGVSPQKFHSNEKLVNFFDVLSTNFDRNGSEFLSCIESKKYPIYATQFHPEMPSFEWGPASAISHIPNAVASNNYFAQFFVSEARRNQRKFDSHEDTTKYLIYNYHPDYTGKESGGDEQTYFFDLQ